MRSSTSPGAPDSGAVATVNELGHLASGVGHHVINAFSAIVSNAEILRMKLALPEPPDPTGLAEAIIRTSLEASSVARRLIDVTRPLTETGLEAVALDALVKDYVAEQAENAGSHKPKVRWIAKTQPTRWIIGNPAYLRSMLDHLTTNAIEAVKNSGEIEIRISTDTDSRGWVVLEIRDTGTGMAGTVLERAVEPFYSTKTDHLGVGLSIANGIWRRHKGTLAIRSIADEGTSVRLCVEPMKTPALPPPSR